MKIRRRTRAKEEPLGALLPAFTDGRHAEPVARCALPDELLAQQEVRAIVRRCIERLPDRHRAVLVMRDIEELSTEETAAALGVTANTAKIRLHRARQALATLLRQELDIDTRLLWGGVVPMRSPPDGPSGRGGGRGASVGVAGVDAGATGGRAGGRVGRRAGVAEHSHSQRPEA